MNQKKLNAYVKYMTSLSDEDREALYTKAKGFSFSNEEVQRRLREPLKRKDKSPYSEFDGGFGYDTYFPQITITKLTDNNIVDLGNGIKMKRHKRKNKMEYKEVNYKGEIKRRLIQAFAHNESDFCDEIIFKKICDDMAKEDKQVTMEMVATIAETWKNSLKGSN